MGRAVIECGDDVVLSAVNGQIGLVAAISASSAHNGLVSWGCANAFSGRVVMGTG